MKKYLLLGWAAALLALVSACQSTEPTSKRDPAAESDPAAEVKPVEVAQADPTAAPTATIPAEDFYADWLPVIGEAPEIDNEVWINSDPLTMAELKGKVVLVEFWTFG